ncbi:MAG: sigma-70 family RNA polymerase sigma factor [Deltaproteobacteria bacterium]|nr:sigma-70 family RNA polymerase sigma factor [Deltaproteobacteria bacterium]
MNDAVLSDNLNSYIAGINKYPLLTIEEEFGLAERYFRDKELDAAHRLVTANLRFVVKIAFEYRNYGCRLADLIQEGNIGLMLAVKKFNPHKGFRLITYAAWWIRAYMQDFILKTKGLVRHATKELKRRLFYRKDPLTEALSPDAEFFTDLSLDSPIADDKTTHLDMLCSTEPEPMDALSTIEEKAIVQSDVHGALAVLNDRERLIVEKRFMADEPLSLQAVGDMLGITRERVRQIESSAVKKLKNALSGKNALLALNPDSRFLAKTAIS